MHCSFEKFICFILPYLLCLYVCGPFHKIFLLLYVSDDSREMPAYSELMHDASHAIAQVQRALNSRSVTFQLELTIMTG